MATISTRKGYRVLNWTDATGQRKQTSLAKVGVLSAKQERDILITKEFELSTGARILNVNRRPAPRFEQFARDYLIWHAAEWPDSHFRVAQIVHDHLLPEFGLDPLNLISVEKAEAYKTARKFRVRGSTVTKELRVLHAMLNRAVRLKVIADNPIAIVQAPKQLDSKPHHWYEDPEDLTKLYAASDYGPVWRFMANTGLRRGEALHMRRVWVTDAVRIQSTGEERTKAGKWRKIPFTDGARIALEAIPESVYLLPRIAPESLSRAFARDARACGLEGSLHSLRHTYICRLLLAGVPIRTVQLYAGHASITTTEKYAYQVLKQDPESALRLSI
jgi:integrase